MRIEQSFLLGALQGITEFLPISSSAHLVFLQHFFNLKEAPILFDCLLHFSTLLVTLIFFRKKIREIVSFTPEGKTLIKLIILASLPTGVIGFLFGKTLERTFGDPLYPAFFLLVTGLLLLGADKIYKRRSENKPSENKPKGSTALLIGIIQGIALLPGISRSGSTISAGVILGWTPTFAAEFSFLLSIPAIFGVTLIKLLQEGWIGLGKQFSVYLPGMLSAFFFGLIGLRFLWRSLVKHNWRIFSYYCFALGLTVLFVRLFAK